MAAVLAYGLPRGLEYLFSTWHLAFTTKDEIATSDCERLVWPQVQSSDLSDIIDSLASFMTGGGAWWQCSCLKEAYAKSNSGLGRDCLLVSCIEDCRSFCDVAVSDGHSD